MGSPSALSLCEEPDYRLDAERDSTGTARHGHISRTLHTHTHTHTHRWRVKHSKHGEGERSKEYRVQCTDVEDRVTGFEAQFYPIITVASVSSSVK